MSFKAEPTVKKHKNFIKKIVDKKTLKYFLFGIVNTAVSAAAMFLLYNLLHVDYWIATATYYLVGALIGYFLNKYLTFGVKGRYLKTVLKYILTVVVCFIISYGGARYLISYLFSAQSVKVQDNIAMFTGMALYPVLNYLGQRFFAFAVRRKEKPSVREKFLEAVQSENLPTAIPVESKEEKELKEAVLALAPPEE